MTNERRNMPSEMPCYRQVVLFFVLLWVHTTWYGGQNFG
jgi:hypothetical protein